MALFLLPLYCLLAPIIYGFRISDTKIGIVDLLFPLCLVAACTLRWDSILLPQKAAIAYQLFVLLSTAVLVDTDLFSTSLLKALRLAAIVSPMLLVRLPRDVQEYSKLLRCLKWFLLGGFISVWIGIIGFYLQWEFTRATQRYFFDTVAYTARSGGVFGDSSAYGHLIASWFSLSLFIILPSLNAGKIRRILLIAAIAITSAFGIYVSASRSAALHVAVVCVAAFFLTSSMRQLFQRFAILVGLLVIAVPVWIQLSALADRNQEVAKAVAFVDSRFVSSTTSAFTDVSSMNQALGGRLNTWESAFQEWQSTPYLGRGYKFLSLSGGAAPDNNFVLALTETGLFGLLSLIILTGSFLLFSLVSMRVKFRPSRALALVWLGQIVHGMSVDTMTFAGSTTCVLILSTICFYRIRQSPAFRESSIRDLYLLPSLSMTGRKPSLQA